MHTWTLFTVFWHLFPFSYQPFLSIISTNCLPLLVGTASTPAPRIIRTVATFKHTGIVLLNMVVNYSRRIIWLLSLTVSWFASVFVKILLQEDSQDFSEQSSQAQLILSSSWGCRRWFRPWDGLTVAVLISNQAACLTLYTEIWRSRSCSSCEVLLWFQEPGKPPQLFSVSGCLRFDPVTRPVLVVVYFSLNLNIFLFQRKNNNLYNTDGLAVHYPRMRLWKKACRHYVGWGLFSNSPNQSCPF